LVLRFEPKFIFAIAPNLFSFLSESFMFLPRTGLYHNPPTYISLLSGIASMCYYTQIFFLIEMEYC
jgi:hypothetical protein